MNGVHVDRCQGACMGHGVHVDRCEGLTFAASTPAALRCMQGCGLAVFESAADAAKAVAQMHHAFRCVRGARGGAECVHVTRMLAHFHVPFSSVASTSANPKHLRSWLGGGAAVLVEHSNSNLQTYAASLKPTQLNRPRIQNSTNSNRIQIVQTPRAGGRAAMPLWWSSGWM